MFVVTCTVKMTCLDCGSTHYPEYIAPDIWGCIECGADMPDAEELNSLNEEIFA